MTLSLYTDDFQSDTEGRLPTLRQYLKSKKGKKRPQKFLVVVIWVPNKYPSYGIETEHFRTTVGENTSLGKIIKANWEELIRSEVSTCLQVQEEENGSFSLRFCPGSNEGSWKDIGSDPVLGIRWK